MPFEHGAESSGPVKGELFLDELNGAWLLNSEPSPLCMFMQHAVRLVNFNS
jgi:hypothetical protein